MGDLVLEGCRPAPLAHYLKALAVLRLVSEQKDPTARGFWQLDRFVLRTELSRDDLERFFLEEYQPTPIVGPWGARSGFYPESSEKAAREALEEIAFSKDPRFSTFLETVNVVRVLLRDLGIDKKEKVESQKRELMDACRARLPDEAVLWLDACYVVLAGDERFPPLLGTGGNEGSGSYMSGFAQQLAACLVRRQYDDALRVALWGVALPFVTSSQSAGQFIPESGGTNRGPGFSQKPATNPWDFILCLEGALLFGVAASRKLETDPQSRTASYPFTVETSLAGYSTAVQEKNRGELWVPLWSAPSMNRELLALFREGRTSVGRRATRNGIDFVRAIASLSVDRGIDRFIRYGILERNGQNNIAVALGTASVTGRARARLLWDVDEWLESFRWRATSTTAPASAARAVRVLDEAIFQLCVHGDRLRLQQVLVALGQCERVMAGSVRWTSESFLRPVPPLGAAWLHQVDDGSVELRLAASLASVFGNYGSVNGKNVVRPLRQQLEPVHTWQSGNGARARWNTEGQRDVAWNDGHLVDAMNAVLHRRLTLAVQAGVDTCPDRGRFNASLGDIADFIEGRVDDRRLAELLWGCILIDWTRLGELESLSSRLGARSPFPAALYPLLKACFAGSLPAAAGDGERVRVPVVPEIHRLAATGRGAQAARAAARRLRGSGLAPALDAFAVSGTISVRTAAALLFPIGSRDRALLVQAVTRPGSAEPSAEPEPTTRSGAIA